MLAENHLLGVAHSSEIYTLLVAVVFAGVGIWLGLTLIRGRPLLFNMLQCLPRARSGQMRSAFRN